jgi:hypothetical protein
VDEKRFVATLRPDLHHAFLHTAQEPILNSHEVALWEVRIFLQLSYNRVSFTLPDTWGHDFTTTHRLYGH